MNKLILATAGLTLLIGCKVVEKETDIKEAVSTQASSNNSVTIDLDYMDTEVRPQDDFFQFANGTWVKNNPVPPSESRWGSFSELKNANVAKLTDILEFAAATKNEVGTMEQILGDFYSSYNNQVERNNLGLSPIQDQLDAIRGMNSKSQIVGIVANQHKKGIQSLFWFGVGQDLKDVDNNIVSVGQGGIGLPNKGYYDDEGGEEIQAAYRLYISEVLSNLSEENPKSRAQAIYDFESELSVAMMAPAEMRIPENRYHKMRKSEAVEKFGAFDFEAYLAAIEIESFATMNVSSPKHAAKIGEMIEKVSLAEWKDYLLWKTINHYAGKLDENFVELKFNFYATTLSGRTEMKPTNERAIDEITGRDFGELLGKAFVELHYSDAAQVRINELVDNLLVVFRGRINNLDWMSGETKTQALKKLNSIGRKLGFPDKWEDFSSLKFTKGNYVANCDDAANYSFRKNLSKLGKPVDKEEWGMPAHMVNAYYHPLMNEIAFPAGIMQPPFFDASYEDAVNYGRIGMVIGHEFTHGFDDMGSKFAADGSFTNWWTESDRTLFEERTEKLGNTFANFCPIDGHCVNPQLTMGENIADLGGLTLAYHAYTRTDEFKSGKIIKGYSPAQRFFIAYAQLWKINFKDAELKKRIATDPHSPGMYRVNGPLMNCPEFFEAFNVKEADPMRNSEEEISKIW